jgi:2-aminoethylphosphonate-pyruvate transaminase
VKVNAEAEHPIVERAQVPAARDKLLFTPGPLTTSLSVKQAMLHDTGSWDFEFSAVVARIRASLLSLAGLNHAEGWDVVLLQGSGTFGVEAVFQTCVPPDGKVAVLANGAYGERMTQMLQHTRIEHVVVRSAEDTPHDPAKLDDLLARDKAVTHIAAVHCETTTGLLNPINALGQVARKHRKVWVVDAMSSFGAIPIDFHTGAIDYLISSANKCVEGVPGFSFVFCKRQALASCEGYARSLSLDLLGQLRGFEKNGQFRYTPPTHAILAFDQAVRELDLEGGVPGRGSRYQGNHQVLLAGMRKLGFRPYLNGAAQSCIITAFHTPADPRFAFDTFYRELSARGFIIYPGKLTQVETFRIGSIGRVFPSDIEQLVWAVQVVLEKMGCAVPVRQ